MPATRTQNTIRTRRCAGFRRAVLMTGSGPVVVDEMRAFSEVSVEQTRVELGQSPQLPSPRSGLSVVHGATTQQRLQSARHIGRAIHASQTLRQVVLITDATTGRRRLHQRTLHRVLCKHDQHYFSSNHSTTCYNQAIEGALLFKSNLDVKKSSQCRLAV